MGLFSKKIGPVFLKETSDAPEFIARMEELQKKAFGELAKEIEKQIKIARYGKAGEDNIAFELKNSGMDMYILHDIYLETGELSAQIDYIIITRKHTYVLECKNLIGSIEIDNTGAFLRNYEFHGRKIKEGVYSPITQNQRHLQVLKEVRKSSKTNFLTKMLFEKNFDSYYKSVVVLANPKTYLNARFAPKQIKTQVIRADQLIDYIKQADNKNDTEAMSANEMLELAQFYLSQNRPERSDYVRKYEELLAAADNGEKSIGAEREEKDQALEKETEEPVKKVEEPALIEKNERNKNQKSQEELIKKLKDYRLQKSRAEGIKPYYLFNDAQLKDLIEKNPCSKEELLKVSGFGEVKTGKYGEEILDILTKFKDSAEHK